MGDICGRRGGRDVVKRDEGRAGFEQRERPRFICTCVRKCTPAIDHGRDLASKVTQKDMDALPIINYRLINLDTGY